MTTTSSRSLVFSHLDDEEFDRFSTTHPQNNFVQSLSIVRSQRLRGLKVELIGVKRGNTVLAAGSLLYRENRLGYTTCECQKGPLLDYNNSTIRDFFFSELQTYLRQKGVAELTISPYCLYKEYDADGNEAAENKADSMLITTLQNLGFIHHGFTVNFSNINWMFVKSLEGIKTEDDLLMSLSYRTRKAVRKAQKNGIFIEQATEKTVEEFYETVQQASKEKGFFNRSLDYYKSLVASASPNTVKLLTAKIDLTAYRSTITTELEAEQVTHRSLLAHPHASSKKYQKKIKVSEELIESYQKSLTDITAFKDTEGIVSLASIYFMCHGSEVVSVIGGSIQKYLYFNGATLLYWHMLLYALQHGYSTYNFYGTFGIEDKDAVGHSVYEFKKGFGGHVVQLVGEFTLSVNPIKYRLFHGAKKLAKRVRHL